MYNIKPLIIDLIKILSLGYLLYYFIKNEYYNKNKSTYVKTNQYYKMVKSDYIKDSIFEDRDYNSIYWENSPYKKKDQLLSSKELTFYNILCLYLEDTNYTIFPKVRLGDVIFVNTKYNFNLYFKKIGTKSIDYLICDKVQLTPLIALYLDDNNYIDEDIKKDREYINKSLDKSGIKVYRFIDNVIYDLDYIDEILNIKHKSS